MASFHPLARSSLHVEGQKSSGWGFPAGWLSALGSRASQPLDMSPSLGGCSIGVRGGLVTSFCWGQECNQARGTLDFWPKTNMDVWVQGGGNQKACSSASVQWGVAWCWRWAQWGSRLCLCLSPATISQGQPCSSRCCFLEGMQAGEVRLGVIFAC